MRVSLGLFLLSLPLLAGCRATLVPEPIQVRVGTIDMESVETSLGGISRSFKQRAAWLAERFQQEGCAEHEVRLIDGIRSPSVLCTLHGESDWLIYVSANLDRPATGTGRVDNGTGLALLPYLYAALRVEPRYHTFVFAGFADTMTVAPGGESWPRSRGSGRLLRRLGADGRAQIRAMVELRALGLGSSAMRRDHADPDLRQDLFSVSRALSLPLRSMGFAGLVPLDSEQFRRYFIPTITIHSFDRKTALLLQRPYEDRDGRQIDWNAYADTARLVATFLVYIDQTLQIRNEERSTADPEALGDRR